ncbi:unnamed protein product [Mytilus coruscus]|uniref:Uncharacterized protein n=1 Tax=Mytilus coruscus TaxID=42192 RepID=A0A6J8ANY4_MYTCO|nr:unnamed protein product [Mytilus coruscus]
MLLFFVASLIVGSDANCSFPNEIIGNIYGEIVLNQNSYVLGIPNADPQNSAVFAIQSVHGEEQIVLECIERDGDFYMLRVSGPLEDGQNFYWCFKISVISNDFIEIASFTLNRTDPFSPPDTLYSSEPPLCDICRPVNDNGIPNPSDVDVRLLISFTARLNNVTVPTTRPIVCNIPDGCNIQDPSIECAGCNPVIDSPLESFCRKLLTLIDDSAYEDDSASRRPKSGQKKGYRKYGRYSRKMKNKRKQCTIDDDLRQEINETCGQFTTA